MWSDTWTDEGDAAPIETVLVSFRTDVYLIFTIHQMHTAFGETDFEAKWFHSTYFLKGGSATTALKKRGLPTYLQHALFIKKGRGRRMRIQQ